MKKIEILSTLTLDSSAADADIQRYLAILVLKELEDDDLVRREGSRKEASQVISQLFNKDSLCLDYFAEVRLRAVRAVAELGLIEIAIEQASNRRYCERSNMILLLGALTNPTSIPTLAEIIRNRAEPVVLREKAIISLAAFGRFPRRDIWRSLENVFEILFEFESHWKTTRISSTPEWVETEVHAMRPRGGRGRLRSKLTEEQTLFARQTFSSIISDKKEPESLRRFSLKALRGFAEPKSVELVRRVLFDEWANYGEDAVDVLSDIPDEASAVTLRDFVLKGRADKSLRLRAVRGLGDMEIQEAWAALIEIAEKDPDEQVKTATTEARIKKPRPAFRAQ